MSDSQHLAAAAAAPPGPARAVPLALIKAFVWLAAVIVILFVILAGVVIHLTDRDNQLTHKTAQLSEQNARTLQKLNQQAAANARIRCTALQEQIAVPIGMPIQGHESRVYDFRQRAIDISRAKHLGCHLNLKGGSP